MLALFLAIAIAGDEVTLGFRLLTVGIFIGVKYSQYALEPKAKNEEEPKEKPEEKTDGCYKGLFNELHDNSDLRAALDLIIYMAFDDAIKNYEPRLKELIKQTVEEVFK